MPTHGVIESGFGLCIVGALDRKEGGVTQTEPDRSRAMRIFVPLEDGKTEHKRIETLALGEVSRLHREVVDSEHRQVFPQVNPKCERVAFAIVSL